MNKDHSNDQPAYTLEELLENCEPEHCHEPIECGIAGKELI